MTQEHRCDLTLMIIDVHTHVMNGVHTTHTRTSVAVATLRRIATHSDPQSTILSLRTAQRCGLTHLIDGRFQGVAKGVGSARILGKVHLAPIKIGGVHLPSSFTILDSPVCNPT